MTFQGHPDVPLAKAPDFGARGHAGVGTMSPGAALPAAAQTPSPASLAGQLLVASPSMGDPRFARTVILMVQHDKEGAFEIIV